MYNSWDEIAKHLSQTIRERRLDLNISQGDLARIARISLRRVQQLEAGENSNPSLKTVYSLANALDTDIVELLSVKSVISARRTRANKPADS